MDRLEHHLVTLQIDIRILQAQIARPVTDASERLMLFRDLVADLTLYGALMKKHKRGWTAHSKGRAWEASLYARQ